MLFSTPFRLSSRRWLASPTLLALAVFAGSGAASLAEAATTDERDQHFLAISALIAKDFRQPGERQQAVFAQAGYPDDAWFRKCLTWYALVKGKDGVKEPKKIAEMDKAATLLFTELDAANDAGKLPEPVAQMLNSAGSRTAQLLKDFTSFLNPDEPAPLAEAPRGPERVAIAQAQVTALIEAANKEWAKAKAKIKANEANEKGIWEGDDKDPKVQARIRQATMLRFDAIKVLFNAYSALREVATRGTQFGLDPAPANAYLKALLKENATTLADWDYNFGDFYPLLKAYTGIVMLECIRQGIPNQRIDDLEASVQAVTSIDLKNFKDAASRDEIANLQIRCWTALLKTRLELALAEPDKTKAAAQADKGLEIFENFKDIYKGQKDMTPAAAQVGRAWYVGQLWITAARLEAFKGDNAAATALLGAVAANRGTYASQLASAWMRSLSGGGGGGAGEWGKPTVPADPAQALNVAQAIIRESRSAADDAARRRQLLSAAVQLRAGVAGLNGAWADQFVEVGPEVYDTYARVLNQLDFRYHSAIAIAEGLHAVSSRITKDANPWRKGANFTEGGQKVRTLAKDGMAFTSQLSSRAKGAGVGDLQNEVIELVKRISPEDAGQSADEALILNLMSDREWERAITAAKDYLKKYPDNQPKAYAWMVSSYSGWYEDTKDPKKGNDEAKAKQISAQLNDAAAAMAKEAADALAKKPAPTPERTRDWLRVQSTVQSAQLTLLLADKKFTEVLVSFGPDFWKNPPADESLRARLLRGMCTAVAGAESARVADEKNKNDPQSLLAAWKLYETSYNLYERFLPSIKDPVELDKTKRFGKNMANGFNTVSVLADGLSKLPGAPAGLSETSRNSKRAMADLLGGVITANDKPATIFFVAETLWSLDDHERAVRLYELYRTAIENDPELTTFIAAPQAALDAVGETFGKRPEVANDWLKVRDLVEDKPGLADLRKQGVDEKEYGEKPMNYSDALIALREFRTKCEAQGLKTKLGADGWAQGETAVKNLEKLLQGAIQRISIKARLAQGYREIGQGEKARALYDELYAYEPDNPLYAAAFVDIVLDQVKSPTPPTKEIEEKARDIARKVRNEAAQNLDLKWQSSIQVMELSLALGDSKVVNDALKFDGVNHSGPSYDLVLPALLPDDKQTGDDKRVRRSRNALATELAKRYLALFSGNGISEKPTYRIDDLTLPDGKPLSLFVPSDAPKFVAVTVTNQDDIEVVAIVEEGKSAQKDAAPAAPAAPVAAPAPAAPAPAPAAPVPAPAAPAPAPVAP